MKKSDNPRNTSRRSFIKKSVVASVAATNLTMFSGLVNAENGGPSSSLPFIPCELFKSKPKQVQLPTEDGGVFIVMMHNACGLTFCTNPVSPQSCGFFYETNSDGTLKLDSAGIPIEVDVDVYCGGKYKKCIA